MEKLSKIRLYVSSLRGARRTYTNAQTLFSKNQNQKPKPKTKPKEYMSTEMHSSFNNPKKYTRNSNTSFLNLCSKKSDSYLFSITFFKKQSTISRELEQVWKLISFNRANEIQQSPMEVSIYTVLRWTAAWTYSHMCKTTKYAYTHYSTQYIKIYWKRTGIKFSVSRNPNLPYAAYHSFSSRVHSLFLNCLFFPVTKMKREVSSNAQHERKLQWMCEQKQQIIFRQCQAIICSFNTTVLEVS